MTVRAATPPNPDDDAVIKAASDVIEAEQENIKIEIVMAKAIRVGVMLNNWRTLMIDGGFTEEWVEGSAYDIFQVFFPPPVTEVFVGDHDYDD